MVLSVNFTRIQNILRIKHLVKKVIWIPVFTGMTFLTALFFVIPAKAEIQFFVMCVEFQLVYESTKHFLFFFLPSSDSSLFLVLFFQRNQNPDGPVVF